MKFATYVAIAATLFAVASAVTLTQYSDAACKTAVATSADSPNPFVAKLNECTKYGSLAGVSFYIKATTCAAGKVTSARYGDSACAVKIPLSDDISDTDKCVANSVGGGSSMITCSSTSSVTMAFLAVAAAVLALSF
jgi:hypothetical protein